MLGVFETSMRNPKTFC